MWVISWLLIPPILAQHELVRGTLTLLNNALLSAHFLFADDQLSSPRVNVAAPR
jgi:hypothetical protein